MPRWGCCGLGRCGLAQAQALAAGCLLALPSRPHPAHPSTWPRLTQPPLRPSPRPSIILSALAPQRLAAAPVPKPSSGAGQDAGAADGAGSPHMGKVSSYQDLVNMDIGSGQLGLAGWLAG
jgi:hypothetical protein